MRVSLDEQREHTTELLYSNSIQANLVHLKHPSGPSFRATTRIFAGLTYKPSTTTSDIARGYTYRRNYFKELRIHMAVTCIVGFWGLKLALVDISDILGVLKHISLSAIC